MFFVFSIQTFYAQVSIKTDLSFGVNYATTYRRHITAPNVETLLPAHSYSANVNVQYAFSDSSYVVFAGIGVLKRPIIYILGDEDVSSYPGNSSSGSMVFGYDTFRRKQNYYFIEYPIYLIKYLNCGLGFLGGISFKLHQESLLKADKIFERLSYKNFNYGVLVGLNYKVNYNLSISLRTDFEYMPFVKEVYFENVSISNFNTLLSLGYTFKLK